MILFFDTETNNLPDKCGLTDIEIWPRIVQIAWAVYYDYGDCYSRQSFIIYPLDFNISEESTSIHGISTELAKREGVALHRVLNRLNDDLRSCDMIVAHNLDFDLPVVNTEFKRAGIVTELLAKQEFCTMKSDKIINYCKVPFENSYRDGEYKWPSLSELHMKLFNKSFDGGHNALVDVDACAKCYFGLKRIGVI